MHLSFLERKSREIDMNMARGLPLTAAGATRIEQSRRFVVEHESEP